MKTFISWVKGTVFLVTFLCILCSVHSYNDDNTNILCVARGKDIDYIDYVYITKPKNISDLIWRSDYVYHNEEKTMKIFNGKFSFTCSDYSCMISSSNILKYLVLGDIDSPWSCSYSIYNKEHNTLFFRILRFLFV